MSIVKAITGILVATGMTIGSSGICNASTLDSGRETTATSTTVSAISSGLEDAYREIYSQALTVPPDGTLHKTGQLYWRVTSETPKPGEIVPAFHVGIGWYVYIYLTPSDWNYAVSIGWGGVAGGLCALAGGGAVGGMACGALGSALGVYLSDKTGPKGNQCAEIKVRVGANPVGYKIINKPCSDI